MGEEAQLRPTEQNILFMSLNSQPSHDSTSSGDVLLCEKVNLTFGQKMLFLASETIPQYIPFFYCGVQKKKTWLSTTNSEKTKQNTDLGPLTWTGDSYVPQS